MLAVLKVLLKWCTVITAIVLTHSPDLTAHSKAQIKIILVELGYAIMNFEKETKS